MARAAIDGPLAEAGPIAEHIPGEEPPARGTPGDTPEPILPEGSEK